MSTFALSTTFLVLNIILLISWVALAIIALISLGKKKLPTTPKAIWVIIILCIPVLGSIAYFIIQPEDE